MSAYLRKVIDIGPSGVLYPGSQSDYRQLRQQSWWPELRATTSTIRMWADWPTLQPSASYRMHDPASPGYNYVLALDEQIKAANQDGFAVMLMPYRFPRWSNDTQNTVRGSDADFNLTPWDRVYDKSYWNAWNADKSNPSKRAALLDRLKGHEYRLPQAGFGVDTPWGLFFGDLWNRYVNNAVLNGQVTYLEIVNEPNYQPWPQRSASGTSDKWNWNGTGLFITCQVAEMMQTADALSDFFGPASTPILVAPSTADTDPGTNARYKTPNYANGYYDLLPNGYANFMPDLINRLNTINFVANDFWRWSIHNYRDVENEELRVAFISQYLNGKWAGHRTDNTPTVLVTEGGARLSVVGSLSAQASKIQKSWDALTQQPGVGMAAQYLVYTDPNYDTGLRDAGGAERPAWDVWNAFPRYQ